MYLEPWLEEAVLAGAVTLEEAWKVQDERMLSLEEETPLPQELWPVAERLHLFELETASSQMH